MGHLHRAFLLNAAGFKREMAPILVSLDAGDARPLFERAAKVVEQMESDKWILRLAGASLLDIRKVDSIGRQWPNPIEDSLKNALVLPPYEIGYWLLIVFSIFVQRCLGMGYDYSILEWVLDMLGWSPEERRLLFAGAPTSLLLKPEKDPVSVPSPRDPYWYWMIPSHSKSRGWLSQTRVLEMYHRLLSEKRAIHAFDYSRFRNFGSLRVPEPEAQLYYYQRLQIVFERAVSMFETAQQARMELYMTITYQ